MPNPACAEETFSRPPSCQPPSSVPGTEARRRFAGVTQTLLSVAVLLVSPLPILEGELHETKPLVVSGVAALSLHKVRHPQLQQRTQMSLRSWHREAAQPWAPACAGRAASYQDRQEPYGSAGRSHPACTFPSNCTAPQASTQPMEQGGYGTGLSLMRGIQKCKRSWKEQSATSSSSWQGARGLSRQKPALSSASSELTKAVPGQGTGALGHWRWLCCNITPGVKEAQAPASSHFTCGPWQVPAGCTVRRPARQGARRKKKGKMSYSCVCPALAGRVQGKLAQPSLCQAFGKLSLPTHRA